VSVSFAVAGQITLKSAMDRIGRIGSAQVSEAGDTLLRAAREPRLWLGLFLFGVSALFWLVVLSRVDLSIAYPMVGVSYILVVLFARLFLNEHVPSTRWIGVIVVAMGIAIIGLSFRRT
jgi:drug/metabolite transporter (DMT)-like permease